MGGSSSAFVSSTTLSFFVEQLCSSRQAESVEDEARQAYPSKSIIFGGYHRLLFLPVRTTSWFVFQLAHPALLSFVDSLSPACHLDTIAYLVLDLKPTSSPGNLVRDLYIAQDDFFLVHLLYHSVLSL